MKLGLGLRLGRSITAPPSAPTNTAAPVVTGGPLVGQELSCSTGSWNGNPTPTFTYQWRRDGEDIEGETNNTYTLQSADDGTDVDCVVTATNSEGSDNADSNDISAGTVPVNTVAPVASGTNEVGETLSCTNGTWTGTATISYTYQWRRDTVDISGATSSTYVLVSADAETDVDCVVTGTNDFGNDSADSNDITIAAEEGDGSLQDVVASCCADLDATIAASYGGSGQTWANLVTAPADSTAQTDNDFFFGDDGTVTTDDPGHNGTPGNSACYFSFDGADYFTAKNPTTTFVNNLHKTSTAGWWVAVAFYLPGSTAGNIGLYGSSWGNTDHGFYPWLVGASGSNKSATIWRSYGSGLDNQAIVGASIPEATPSILIVSGNNTTGTNNLRTWLNSATKSQVSKSWTADTTNLNGGWRIGSTDANGSNQGIVKNGTRIYALSYGNAFIDDADAAAIIAAYETRHGRDYTPS